MKDLNLTTKQEIFVLEKLKGKSHTDAYLVAYPTSRKWKRRTVHKRASELMQNKNVREAYKREREKLIEEVKLEAQWDKAESALIMKKIALLSIEDIELAGIDKDVAKAAVDAVKVLNNMFGYDARTEIQKQEMEHNINKSDGGDTAALIVNDEEEMKRYLMEKEAGDSNE